MEGCNVTFVSQFYSLNVHRLHFYSSSKFDFLQLIMLLLPQIILVLLRIPLNACLLQRLAQLLLRRAPPTMALHIRAIVLDLLALVADLRIAAEQFRQRAQESRV